MARSSVERRLSDVAARLTKLRESLRIADAQQLHFVEEEQEARLRALVDESANVQRDHRTAARAAEAMTRHRSEVAAEIARLEQRQDELLDELLARGEGS